MNHELMSKAVYTASEAAQLCNLNRKTILRHVNAGRLKALRIPGSRKRRISRESLLEFMRAQGLSTAALESATQQLPCDDVAVGPSDLLLRTRTRRPARGRSRRHYHLGEYSRRVAQRPAD